MNHTRNALDGPQHRLLDRVPGEAKARAYLDGHAEIARGVASDQDVANALLAVAAARLLRAYGPEAARRKLEAASATLRGAVAVRRGATKMGRA